MEKTKILITGGNGLVGSRIIELLKDKYEFESISRSTGVDIVNREQVLSAIVNSDASIILHLAAKTDVDSCEKDKDLGEKGEAWQINVIGTKNIIEACEQSNKKLIYVSTDFVFSGNDTPINGYSEEDVLNPVNWYAQTKYEAEKLVKQVVTPWIILRPAYPYRANFIKKDFVRILLNMLQQKKQIMAVIDHIMTPVFIDDFVKALDLLIQKEEAGIFHTVGSQFVSPFQAVTKIAEAFNLDKFLINKTTRDEYFKNRAPRPFNISLNNDKIQKLGVNMRSFEEGLLEIKRQLAKNL